MLRCYNKGCGQEYDPEKNFDDSCRFHPGAPYFHDVYKGWTCCNKKSHDFTEFLNIKGCTTAKHSNVTPTVPKQSQQTKSEQAQDEMNAIPPTKPEPLKRPPITTSMKTIKATIAASLCNEATIGKAGDQKASEGKSKICKNSGCNCSYEEACVNNSKCQHHPGVPIFHEGMKYWSCCQRKTSDFTAFMNQAGCSFGDHKWSETVEQRKGIKCRYDWYQTARDVIVSIYSKNYDCQQSEISVNPIRLRALLIFPEQNNGCFQLDLELRGIIDVDHTEVNMLASRVEIVMRKAEPSWWQKLDFPNENLPSPTSSDSENKEQTLEEDKEFNLDDVELALT